MGFGFLSFAISKPISRYSTTVPRTTRTTAATVDVVPFLLLVAVAWNLSIPLGLRREKRNGGLLPLTSASSRPPPRYSGKPLLALRFSKKGEKRGKVGFLIEAAGKSAICLVEETGKG